MTQNFPEQKIIRKKDKHQVLILSLSLSRCLSVSLSPSQLHKQSRLAYITQTNKQRAQVMQPAGQSPTRRHRRIKITCWSHFAECEIKAVICEISQCTDSTSRATDSSFILVRTVSTRVESGGSRVGGNNDFYIFSRSDDETEIMTAMNFYILYEERHLQERRQTKSLKRKH